MKRSILTFVAVLCALASSVDALYFYMQEGDVKCFSEEVPDETIVRAQYKLESFDPRTSTYVEKPELGISVMIENADHEEIMNKVYKESPGHFAFTSKTPGEHKMCIGVPKYILQGQQLRVHLQIRMGEEAADYEAIREREKLDDLQLRIRQLSEQIDQITKEQGYQRLREAKFREISERTNWRVLFWSAMQLCILLASGLWQMRHLKSFFIAKKLV